MLVSLTTVAQDCKPHKTVVDDFTENVSYLYGDRIVNVPTYLLLGTGFDIQLFVSQEKETLILTSILHYSQMREEAEATEIDVQEGSILKLKLASKVQSHRIESVSVKKSKSDGSLYSTFTTTSYISRSDVELLAKELIDKLQIEVLVGEPITSDAFEKGAKKFRKQVQCFLDRPIQAEPTTSNGDEIKNSSASSDLKRLDLIIGADALLGPIGFQGQFEYMHSERFSLGVTGGVTRKKSSSIGSGVFDTYEISTRTLFAGPFIRYYVYNKSKFNVYGGLSYLRGVARVDEVSGFYDGDFRYDVNAFDVHLGTKYNLDNQLYAVAELGLNPSNLRLGLAYKF